MINVSFRDIVLGSAIVGSLSVSGYCAYRWLMADYTEKVRIYDRHFDGVATILEKAVSKAALTSRKIHEEHCSAISENGSSSSEADKDSDYEIITSTEGQTTKTATDNIAGFYNDGAIGVTLKESRKTAIPDQNMDKRRLNSADGESKTELFSCCEDVKATNTSLEGSKFVDGLKKIEVITRQEDKSKNVMDGLKVQVSNEEVKGRQAKENVDANTQTERKKVKNPQADFKGQSKTHEEKEQTCSDVKAVPPKQTEQVESIKDSSLPQTHSGSEKLKVDRPSAMFKTESLPMSTTPGQQTVSGDTRVSARDAPTTKQIAGDETKIKAKENKKTTRPKLTPISKTEGLPAPGEQAKSSESLVSMTTTIGQHPQGEETGSKSVSVCEIEGIQACSDDTESIKTKAELVQEETMSDTEGAVVCCGAEETTAIQSVKKKEGVEVSVSFVDGMETKQRGEFGSLIRNSIFVPKVLQDIKTQRELTQTLEALCAFLFKQDRTPEELHEAQLELGWTYDLAYSFLNKVPTVVPTFKELDVEQVTYANDGTPMEHVD